MFLKKEKSVFPAWLFLLLVLILDEFVFQLWTGAALTPERVLTMLLFTASFALLLGLLASFGSAFVCRIVAIVLALVFAALYFAEYLMHDAYGGEGGYMSLGIIFGTAAAAGNDFRDTIMDVVWNQIWRLLLLLLPIVLYGVFGALRHWGKCSGWLSRGLLAGVCAICFLLGLLTAKNFSDAEKYDKKFDFCEGVNTFGLLTALRLDLVNGERELDFALEETPTEAFELPTVAEPVTTPPAPTEETAPEETGETPTEAPTEPEEPKKEYNAMEIDFAALAETESNAEIAKLHRFVASRTASKTNAYTGLFAGKNLIFITAESFALEVIDPELTPALYRLASKGIQVRDFYQPAWGGSTSTGEFSNMTGLVPTNANAMTNSIGKNMYFTLGNRLIAEGYQSFGYHNNTYTYYHRDQTHPNLGCTVWMGMGNGMEAGVQQTWPESDREMIDYTMDLYLDQQPFCVYYISVSGHGLYSKGGNYLSKKNYDAVADLEAPEIIKCYLAANLELEYALEDLLDRLEQENLLDDTVIVLSPDHYPYCLEQSSTWQTDRDYLQDLYGYPVTDCFTRDHNALLIWSGCLEDLAEPIVVEDPVFSVDIVPTMLNLFGIEFDSRLLAGRDIFSNAEPLVFWSNQSWKTDKGQYDASRGVFTPAAGVEVDQDYINRISNRVSNLVNFSRGVLQWNYYEVLFGS